jgi:hypothetical protein
MPTPPPLLLLWRQNIHTERVGDEQKITCLYRLGGNLKWLTYRFRGKHTEWEKNRDGRKNLGVIRIEVMSRN